MFGLDTNILVYAEGIGDVRRTSFARFVIDKLPAEKTIVPAQALAELFRVLVKKDRRKAADATLSIRQWKDMALVAPTAESTLWQAADLVADHGLQIFDAIIFTASAEAGCRLLLSEDMQDGFVWRGVTVVNPFAAALHPLLADALRT